MPALAALAFGDAHLGRDGGDAGRQALAQRLARGGDLPLLLAQEDAGLRAQELRVQGLQLFTGALRDLLADQRAGALLDPGGLPQRHRQQPAEDRAAQQRDDEGEGADEGAHGPAW